MNQPQTPPASPAPTPPQEDPVAASVDSGDPLTIDSAELLQNHREITIRHGEETYRLRLTKSGKLILHK